MKYVALTAIIFLSGCMTKPVLVKMDFPDAPHSLLKKCEELKTIETKASGTPITELLKTVVQNYTLYYECSNRVEGWNEWYTNIKKIYDEVGK